MTGFIWAAAAVCAVGLGGRMVYEAKLHTVRSLELSIDRLPAAFDGCRILFVSDLHRRLLSAQKMEQLHGAVDWVILGGDIMERNVPLQRVEENIKMLTAIAPTFAVYGNHDYKADPDGLEDLLHKYNVKLLKDENVALDYGGNQIWLTGIDYPRFQRNDYKPLPELSDDPAVHDCRLIIVHDPAWIKNYPVIPGDLILAGHTHGGQITMPFIGPIRLNSFYRRYASGLFHWEQPNEEVEHARMLISRGFGTRRVPLRLCCPAEMHLITLRSGK